MKFLMLLVAFTMLSACSSKVFKDGSYDNVDNVNLLNDKWSESDMQQVVKSLVESLAQSPAINGKDIPVVMVTSLQNKTSEHIDTQSVMDMVTVELMNTGKVQFVDKAARDDIEEEYKYQGDGTVSQESKKSRGNQVGADYIINGRLDSIVQEVGKDKTVYYKVTLNLTSLERNVILWSNYKQVRKIYKKKSVGL